MQRPPRGKQSRGGPSCCAPAMRALRTHRGSSERVWIVDDSAKRQGTADENSVNPGTAGAAIWAGCSGSLPRGACSGEDERVRVPLGEAPADVLGLAERCDRARAQERAALSIADARGGDALLPQFDRSLVRRRGAGERRQL